VSLNYFIPLDVGYERPERVLNRSEKANMEKLIANVKHKEGIDNKIDAFQHQITLFKALVSGLKNARCGIHRQFQ